VIPISRNGGEVLASIKSYGQIMSLCESAFVMYTAGGCIRGDNTKPCSLLDVLGAR
jgi:hypothetical protein